MRECGAVRGESALRRRVDTPYTDDLRGLKAGLGRAQRTHTTSRFRRLLSEPWSSSLPRPAAPAASGRRRKAVRARLASARSAQSHPAVRLFDEEHIFRSPLHRQGPVHNMVFSASSTRSWVVWNQQS